MRSQDHLSRRELLTSGLFCATATGVSLSFAALAPSFQARRMLQERRFRVLMITYRGATDVDHGFRRYLLDAGLDVEFIARDVKQDASQVAHILDELPTLAPDLIYTWGTPVTLAVAGTTDHPNTHPALLNTPIVFALVAEPQKAGIVRNLSAPERNVTGAIHIVPLPQQLLHMRNYRAFDKLGVLYNADEANSQAMVQSLKQYGEQHGVKILARSLHPHRSGKPEAGGLEELIDEIAQAGAQWLYLPPDTYLGTIYERITPLAMARQLPLFASTELAMRTGNALTGLVSRYDSVGQLAGSQALDLLLGKKTVQETPVESLKRFSLQVNMQMAQQLQLYPPLQILNYAEVVAMAHSQGSAS